MTQTAPTTPLSIDELPWPEIELPPTDLPYDDGDKLESPWHAHNPMLLEIGYRAAHGGQADDYYFGVNMFVYYSMDQVRNRDYRGPDAFIVKDVDGTRPRLSWIAWAEGGRLPDVIFEFLSKTTEREDLGVKKRLYEQVFHTAEYFCIAPEVERLLGWRLNRKGYVAIKPDQRGWLWSEELGLWLGAWKGMVMGLPEEHTWVRFYDRDGALVRLPDEAERERAEIERERADTERERAEIERERADTEREQKEAALEGLAAERTRADDLAARLAALEAELSQLRGDTKN